MYHSITFSPYDKLTMQSGKNTWTDWHLVPASRPVFNPPPLKEHVIDIPGKNGVLDLSESITGFPVFDRREGTMEFYVMNGYQTWDVRYSTIMEYLHGRVMRAVLEDDPNYFYEGRFSINEWRSEKDYSRIIFGYKVDPYKRAIQTSSQVRPSRYIKTIQLNSIGAVVVYSTDLGSAPTYPIFTVSGEPGDKIRVSYSPTYGRVLDKSIVLETGNFYELQDALLHPVMDEYKSFVLETNTQGQGRENVGPVTVQVDFRKGIL